MIGPYLTTEATCPTCGVENVLGHLEKFSSPAKAVLRCTHLRAVEWDEDGNRLVDFATDEPG